jgi:hypothetical protein
MGIRKNFIARKGLEISDDLIFAEENRVGIKTITPSYTLDVNGDIGTSEIVVSDRISLNGELELDGNSGSVGQYLVSTGGGVRWQDVPGLRELSAQTAEENQTIFNINYTPSAGIDVFVNGARLSPSDYIATNGTTVEFIVPCFGGENIDFISYSVFGSSSPGISIQNNSTPIGSDLSINSINFIGFKDVGINQAGIGVTVYNETDNVSYSGVVTALGGFISVGNTTPVQISVSSNKLIFTVAGIGSTSFNLA